MSVSRHDLAQYAQRTPKRLYVYIIVPLSWSFVRLA